MWIFALPGKFIMENKIIKNLIPALLILILIIAGLFAARFITKNITVEQNGKPASKSTNTYEVNKKAFDSIASPNSSNASISLDASGFGRTDPFAPYK